MPPITPTPFLMNPKPQSLAERLEASSAKRAQESAWNGDAQFSPTATSRLISDTPPLALGK